MWWFSGTIVTTGFVARLGCTLKESSALLEEAESILLEDNLELSQVEQAYKSIMDVQLNHVHNIKNVKILDNEQINECFRNGKSLFMESNMRLDGVVFSEIQRDVCKTIKDSAPEAPETLLTLPDDKVFQEEHFETFVDDIALLNKAELQKYISEKKLDQRSGLNNEVISFIIFMSLTPFYSVYMEKVREENDFSLWRQGYCPICAQNSIIARHRATDQTRILFCWLCHAEWYFPRLECPYCDNNNFKKLRYFYVDDDRTRQVHVCENCKRYLKTIVGETLEKAQLLNVEDIETRYLDIMAEQEGYKRPI